MIFKTRPGDGPTASDALVVALTKRVSSPSSLWSLMGVRVKTCDPVELPPSIVTSKSVTASKSVDSSAESPSAETVSTTSSESGAPFSVAVTLTSREPPSSSTADVSTPMRTAVDAASLSLTDTATVGPATPA